MPVIEALIGFTIALVATLWIIGYQLAARFSSLNFQVVLDVTSAILCALGLFWFVERALSI